MNETNKSGLDSIVKNAEETERQIALLLEKRTAYSFEYAAFSDNGTIETSFFPVSSCPELNFTSEVIKNKLTLCDRVISALEKSKKTSFETVLSQKNAGYTLNTVGKKSKLVYMKNKYTDKAAAVFSKCVTSFETSYADSFQVSAEDVYYGKAEFCILPLENSYDGRLSGFCSVLKKFELKISLECEIENDDGEYTVFALVSKNLTKGFNVKKVIKTLLQVDISLAKDQKLSDVLETAEQMGYNLYKAECIPDFYSENGYRFELTFEGEGNVCALCCWLESQTPRYDFVGVYTKIAP